MVKFTPVSIVMLAIGIYFLAFTIPAAISEFFNASTAGWDAGVVALWGLIPLALVALLVLIFVPRDGGGE